MVRRDYRLNTIYSIEGNTVKVVKSHAIDQTKLRKERASRARTKACTIGPAYALLFLAACVTTLFLCLNYIRVYSSITTLHQKIDTLKSDVQTLHSENLASEIDLAMQTDLNHVEQIARQELHMVAPEENQILFFNRNEREYVRQREDLDVKNAK